MTAQRRCDRRPASRQFAAGALDQFGTAMSPPTSFAWATTGGGTTDTAMYIMYARVGAMDTPPTAAQVGAIAMGSATPDTTAWADWPLVLGDPADVSGHGRHLTVVGAVAPGVAGPPIR